MKYWIILSYHYCQSFHTYNQNKTTTTTHQNKEKKEICLNRKTNLWNPNNLGKYYSALCSNSDSQPLLYFAFQIIIIKILKLGALSFGPALCYWAAH